MPRAIEFVSFRENIDTGGPLGRAIVVIVGAIAELERNLIIERVKAGMRRAELDGRQIGRTPMNITEDKQFEIGALACRCAKLPRNITSLGHPNAV